MKTIRLFKNPVFLLLLMIAIGSMYSFTSYSPFSSPKKKMTENAGAFVIRHAGLHGNTCTCPGCRCPGCPCPLGICGCGILRNFSSGGDLAADEGSCTVYFVGNMLHMKFNQTTAVNYPSISENDVVPVSGNLIFDESLANALGYGSITVPSGYYEVN